MAVLQWYKVHHFCNSQMVPKFIFVYGSQGWPNIILVCICSRHTVFKSCVSACYCCAGVVATAVQVRTERKRGAPAGRIRKRRGSPGQNQEHPNRLLITKDMISLLMHACTIHIFAHHVLLDYSLALNMIVITGYVACFVIIAF